MSDGCVFCDRERLRELAEVYLENGQCVYASTRDPRDPPDVLPGSGVIVPIAHKASPFDLGGEEWAATHELLLAAKEVWDARLAPDGYGVGVKGAENRRPDPLARSTGRALRFGRRRWS